MSDLVGRFLSFDEHLGRGLVKFAYFVGLFYIVVTHIYLFFGHLFDLSIGALVLIPFKFLLWVLIIRIAAEFVIAVLSIDDHLQGVAASQEGFEAGLTPSKGNVEQPTPSPSSKEEPIIDIPSSDGNDQDAESEEKKDLS